jgi:hypothetical protein
MIVARFDIPKPHVAMARVGATSTTAPPSTSSSGSALDLLTGPGTGSTARSCSMQQGIVVSLTAAAGLVTGFMSRSVILGLLAAVVGNVIGRKINGASPTTGATCLTTDQRQALLNRVLSKEVSGDDAEKMAQSYDLSGCTEDAAAIRLAAKTAASGDLIAHTPPLGLPYVTGGGDKTKGDVGTEVPPSGGNLYALTAADIASKPTAFALRAGYPSVEAFIANQGGKLTAENATPPAAPADASDIKGFLAWVDAMKTFTDDAAIYATDSPLSPDPSHPVVLYHRIVPWTAGTVVVTLSPIAVVAPFRKSSVGPVFSGVGT